MNQNAINRYVEYYLLNGGFSNMIGRENQVRRETFLGVSKLDFLVGNTYLEVKTPLQHLQIDIPEYVIKKKSTPFSSTERFIKHITELAKTLKNHERAILLNCFIYDNPGFQIIEKSTHYEEVKNAVDNSLKAGVELWQANFKITDKEIKLIKYFKITNI
ncbi:DNA/RNA nuclease SfsA [Clostridium perfringens]|uniref:DNA/RNA nuclease SfsA n=1 Tax=Clostridium perfringens TaxID=1502 RepID=UPI0034E8AA82